MQELRGGDGGGPPNRKNRCVPFNEVGVWPYFCDRPQDSIPWRSELYWNSLAVSAPLKYEMQKKSGVFAYYVFLDVAFTAKQPSSYESFDLRTHPEDICFRVGGGFAGRGFKSNVVVIPKPRSSKRWSRCRQS